MRDDDDSDDDTDDDTDAVMRVGSASANDERLVNARESSRNAPAASVVLTAEAGRATEFRAPHDVANLASLFGMRDENARAALSTRALRLVRRARRKRAREKASRGGQVTRLRASVRL